MPLIDRDSPTPYYQQVYEQIARGIDQGLYPVGGKLPSIRECARELAVSNTTVEFAYQRLVEEGYVEARRGSGYVICATVESPATPAIPLSDEYRATLRRLAHTGDADARKPVTWNFAYDAVDPATFPYATWARICRDVFFNEGSELACLYNDRQGLRELREQIAYYLGREYGLSASADQILVMPTTRDLVSDIMTLFDPATVPVAMEEPGYDEVAVKLGQSGFHVRALPMHPTPTWEELERAIDGAQVVFTTPACQFPTNTPLPVELRRELVTWAERTGASLIDDEYGWEFQSGTERTPSLATFDRTGCVITLGTFSNVFTPAACLSFAVLPPQLMLKWRTDKEGSHPTVHWQTQAAMALFMRDGHWRTHVRKMRTAMTRKRHALMEAVETHLGGAVKMLACPNSSFVLLQATDGRGEEELVEAARHSGVRVYPTSRYWSGAVPDSWRYVLVGFAGIPLEDIAPGIRALADAWDA